MEFNPSHKERKVKGRRKVSSKDVNRALKEFRVVSECDHNRKLW